MILDALGIPLLEDVASILIEDAKEDDRPTEGMYYVVVPKSDKDKILKQGIKPIHYREYLFLLKSDALSHAEYLEKHWSAPVSVFGIDPRIKVWHVKNAIYWRDDKKVHVVAVHDVPASKVHHLMDLGKERPETSYKRLGNFKQMLKKGKVKRGQESEEVDQFGVPELV